MKESKVNKAIKYMEYQIQAWIEEGKNKVSIVAIHNLLTKMKDILEEKENE